MRFLLFLAENLKCIFKSFLMLNQLYASFVFGIGM